MKGDCQNSYFTQVAILLQIRAVKKVSSFCGDVKGGRSRSRLALLGLWLEV